MLLAFFGIALAADEVRHDASATTMQRLRDAAETAPVRFGPLVVGERRDVEVRIWGCATKCRAIVMSGGSTMFSGAVDARKGSEGTWELRIQDPALPAPVVLERIQDR